MSNIQNDIEKAMQGIAKDWKKKKRQADRFGRVKFSTWELEDGFFRTYQHDQICEVLPEAVEKATGEGKYVAVSRQIYYVVRSLLSIDIENLDSSYFQKVLKDFLEENEEYQERVIWDARGNLREPHTRIVVPMGGVGVERYMQQWTDGFEVFTKIGVRKLIDTYGAANRFSAVLFLEKEGFNELLQKAGILEKYDIAIMSTKGVPNKAACDLIEQFDNQGVKIFALHDFDLAGFTIMRTLRNGVRLANGTESVIELGLRYPDIAGLQSERVKYERKESPKYYLYGKCDATREEADFLVSSNSGGRWYGERVELNAFTSDKFIAWLEKKLQEHGVKKVIPDKDTLIKAYQRAVFMQRLSEKALELQEEMKIKSVESPVDLEALVKQRASGLASWDKIVWDIAEELKDKEVTYETKSK